MGIVVTVVLLLGLLFSFSLSRSYLSRLSRFSTFNYWIAIALLFVGLWNSVWYGFVHWPTFWAKAAAISGVLMVLNSLLLLKHHKVLPLFLQRNIHYLMHCSPIITLGLFVCFLLYAITIIQLNLGYPIIS